MEHEVFVPFPAETVRQALADPARIARCVPGLQPETTKAGADVNVVSGRLRVRVGGSTITYRGTISAAPRDRADVEERGNVPGFTVECEGVEARGTGTVKLGLWVGVEDAESGGLGTLLTFAGTARADGRLAEFEDGVLAAAGRRLLDRFVAELIVDLPPVPDLVDNAGLPEGTDAIEDIEDIDVIEVVDLDAGLPEFPEIPESAAELDPLLPGDVPAAEAAHARRTMIGRSAEEVDHAPPRGRYAPAPAPQTGSATATLRWAAPAAAALLASAVVVGRVLRRRK